MQELEDDVEDDFMKQYMEKRLNEMKEIAKKNRYGSVQEISKDQYIAEVTNAPKEDYVVLHLYQSYNEQCELINREFIVLANKYPSIKFLKIIATRCVENFPD